MPTSPPLWAVWVWEPATEGPKATTSPASLHTQPWPYQRHIGPPPMVLPPSWPPPSACGAGRYSAARPGSESLLGWAGNCSASGAHTRWPGRSRTLASPLRLALPAVTAPGTARSSGQRCCCPREAPPPPRGHLQPWDLPGVPWAMVFLVPSISAAQLQSSPEPSAAFFLSQIVAWGPSI